MPKCEKCGENYNARENYGPMKHECPPLWHVHLVDFDEPGVTHQVYGHSPRDAAENYVIDFDHRAGDYPILHKGKAQVVVWSDNKRKIALFDIEAEMRPIYGATKPEDQTLPESVLNAVW